MAGRRAILFLALAGGLALLAAAAALAVTGEIVPQLCIEDNDPPPGDSCSGSTDGLAGVVAGAASPDGRSFYTASVSDDAVAEFLRNPSGALSGLGCVQDAGGGSDSCAVTAPGLDGAFSIAVSADGRSVYVAAFDDDSIVGFDRDPATGALFPQGCIDDDDAGQGPDSCSQSTDGLDGVVSVAVSPDGRSVYAASLNDDAVVRFDRNVNSGALDPQGCIDDNDAGQGPDACSQSTDGLDGARSIAISPDGRSVYAASGPDDAVVRFSRDPQDGRLVGEGCIDDDDPGQGPDTCSQSTDGLDGARTVVVSPNGKSVYATAQIDDALVRFDRDTDSGSLTPQGCVDDDDSGADTCSQASDGLDGAFGATVSPDGLSVYVAALDDDAVVRLDRNPGSGALSPQGCVDDNDPPDGPDACGLETDGLGGAVGVTSNAGTTSLYVESVSDDAIVWLVREDDDPPNTTITDGPARRTKKRHASFEFDSSEPSRASNASSTSAASSPVPPLAPTPRSCCGREGTRFASARSTSRATSTRRPRS